MAGNVSGRVKKSIDGGSLDKQGKLSHADYSKNTGPKAEGA